MPASQRQLACWRSAKTRLWIGARYHEAANWVHKARVPADVPAISHLPAQGIRNGFRRPSGYGKALPGDRLGQLRDARRSVFQQMHRHYIPKFDPPQLHRVVHHRTVACRSDSAHSRTRLDAQRRAHRHRQLCGYGCDRRRDISPAITVANFTVKSTRKRNIVTFANVVLIACSVARTDFPIRKVVRF